MESFAIQKRLFILLLLEDIVAWNLYFKHKLFCQSELGRIVEVRKTHITLFKTLRDVMQVSTLSAQLALGSELLDWYGNAQSIPYGHLLIDVSPRTGDRLRYCTNTGSIPSSFYVSERLKHLKSLDDEHNNCLYSASVRIIFQQVQKSFPFLLSKRSYPVSLRMHGKSAQRKPAMQKKISLGNFSKRISTNVSKSNKLEAKKRHSDVRKMLTADKSRYSCRH